MLPLNLDRADEMHEVFKQVSLTRHVSVEEAKRYGLYDENDPDMPVTLDEDGLVEISQWRHAITALPASATGYTQTRYPIVLVHGLFGFDSLGPLEYFYGIPGARTAARRFP